VHEVAADEIDARVTAVLLGAPRLRQPVHDARVADTRASHRAIETVLAHQLVEPVEGIVVGGEEQLADLVAHGDRAAVAIGEIAVLERLSFEQRVIDERRVGSDGPSGLTREIAEFFERGHGGEQLHGARRVEVFSASAIRVLDQAGAPVAAWLDRAEHGLEAHLRRASDEWSETGIGGQDVEHRIGVFRGSDSESAEDTHDECDRGRHDASAARSAARHSAETGVVSGRSRATRSVSMSCASDCRSLIRVSRSRSTSTSAGRPWSL
jgi:hypothetical protein